jgi:TPR repeat protein
MFNFFQKQKAKAAGKALAKSVLTIMEQAEAGDPESQFQMGIQYHQGQLGFPKDNFEAANWYRKAAEQGHAGAQLYLGVFLAQGQGVEIDLIEAFKWLELAKRGNARDKTAADDCQNKLVAFMTPDQIVEGQRRAREKKGIIRAIPTTFHND